VYTLLPGYTGMHIEGVHPTTRVHREAYIRRYTYHPVHREAYKEVYLSGRLSGASFNGVSRSWEALGVSLTVFPRS